VWRGRRDAVGPVPVEFRFFDAPAWGAFNRLLRKRMIRAGVTGRVEPPGVLVTDDGERLSLLSLAQACNAAPARRWAGLVDAHLAPLVAGPLAPVDPTEARRLLKVRLVPDDLEPDVSVPYATGVLAGLVLDLPRTVVGVRPAQLDDWGLSLDEAWALAWSNVGAEPRPEELERLSIDGAEVVSVYGDSFFTASKVAFLPRVIGPIGSAGALVTIPRRHTLLAHVLGNGPANAALAPMVLNTRRLHVDGPGSISPHLYWWVDGSLVWVPAAVDDDGRIEVYPPPGLAEQL